MSAASAASALLVPQAPYNDVACSNAWSSADDTVIDFDRIHAEIYKILLQDPMILETRLIGRGGFLSVEPSCACRMDINSVFGPEVRFVCPGCTAIAGVNSAGPDIKTLEIVAGKYFGMSFQVHTFATGRPVCQKGAGPSNRATELVRCRPCDQDLLTARYLDCDLFTQTYLISIFWEHYMRSKGMPALHVLSGFVCGGIGYLFLQNKKKVTNLGATADNLRALLFQLLLQLRMGDALEMTLGLTDLSVLEFDQVPFDANVDGTVVRLPFQLCMRLDHHAGLSVPSGKLPTRLFLRRLQTEIGISRLRNGCDLHQRANLEECTDMCGSVGKSTYKITAATKTAFVALREGGIPIYRSSIDFYALMLSLMSWKPFYDVAHSDDLILTVWQKLWNPLDLETVEDQVMGFHNKTAPTFHELLDIIVDFEIQCDPVTEAWRSVSQIFMTKATTA